MAGGVACRSHNAIEESVTGVAKSRPSGLIAMPNGAPDPERGAGGASASSPWKVGRKLSGAVFHNRGVWLLPAVTRVPCGPDTAEFRTSGRPSSGRPETFHRPT